MKTKYSMITNELDLTKQKLKSLEHSFESETQRMSG